MHGSTDSELVREGYTAAPDVSSEGVTFTFPDPDRNLAAVVLHQELRRPRHGPQFTFKEGAGTWKLSLPRPRVDRMEYRFDLRHPDGGAEAICDPANPKIAPGPFGDKSVIEWPDYVEPSWCTASVDEPGTTAEVELPSKILRAPMHVVVWASPGAAETDELPLLVAHDGPELAQFSSLLRFLAVTVSLGRLPAMRAALLAPIDRDQHYSASAVYSRALAFELMPALARLFPIRPGRAMRVGIGASLGALAMLHAHRTYPATFGALFLQSGSFFRQRFDKQEAGFIRFRRITRFVGQVLSSQDWHHSVPAVMTCGAIEENLANNRAVLGSLKQHGYDAELHELPDTHNWVAWRDAWDPHLVGLLARMWA